MRPETRAPVPRAPEGRRVSDPAAAPSVLEKAPTALRRRRVQAIRARALATHLGIIAVTTVITSFMITLVWRGFTYWGDNAESFFPLWLMWGTAIRSGEPFL